MEQLTLTPQQQEDFKLGIELAWEANDAFDEMRYNAVSMAVLLDDEATNMHNLIHNFMSSKSRFEALLYAASLLMPPLPPRKAFAAAETAEPIEPFASAEVWGLMTPEQRQTAGEVREAMADRFKKYGVTAKDLRVVMTEAEKGERIFTLVHTGSGIDIGDPTNNYDPARSYPCVMSKKNDPLFIVTIDGKQYDTRKGMTSAVYDALYQDAIGRIATLPDSEQMSEETKYKRTHTILTGESLSLAGLVLVRCVLGGKISRDVRDPNIDFRGLSVRPAAVIGIYLPHPLPEAA